MFCPECGRETKGKFCSFCGALTDQPSPDDPFTEPQQEPFQPNNSQPLPFGQPEPPAPQAQPMMQQPQPYQQQQPPQPYQQPQQPYQQQGSYGQGGQQGGYGQSYQQPPYQQAAPQGYQPPYQQQPTIIINNANNNSNVNANAGGGLMVSPKSKVVALLLCFFFGFLGIHRFYVGKVGTGLLWMLTGGICGIGALIDLISILLGHFTDGAGYPIKN